MLGSVIDEMALPVGQNILEVGSGSGAVSRWLPTRTNGNNPITGVDISPYLIREAQTLAVTEGLLHRVAFQPGNAEALPFADATFGATLSVTVMEEVDADRMLAEMVRVTKPGGRIAVVVRATDLPHWFNVTLPSALKSRIEQSMGGGNAVRGCADQSLYRRFLAAGLTELKVWPQLVPFYPGLDIDEAWVGAQNNIFGALTHEEAEHWRDAVAQTQSAGGLIWAAPFHCAVGTKPDPSDRNSS